MKYPIRIQSFEQIIEDGYAYIDKTDLVYKLTHEVKRNWVLTTVLPRSFVPPMSRQSDAYKTISIRKPFTVFPLHHCNDKLSAQQSPTFLIFEIHVSLSNDKLKSQVHIVNTLQA